MNINGYFIFDGFDTRTLSGVTVVRGETLESPARDFDVREIPGRNGDLLLDNRKYPNTEITYRVMIRENVESTFRQLAGFLLSRTGYCKLSDSWSTSEFYMAYVSQPIAPTVSRGDELGAFEVVFNRKPQRFLVSGETPAEITPSTGETPSSSKLVHLVNPAWFSARPQIKVKLAVDAGSTNFFIYQGALFTQTIRNYSDWGTKAVYKTQKEIYLYKGFQQSMSDYAAAGDEILIDCESRSVYNLTKNKSINEIVYIRTAWYEPGDANIHTAFENDFPEIPVMLSTDYVSYSLIFQNSRINEITVLPRWWTI